MVKHLAAVVACLVLVVSEARPTFATLTWPAREAVVATGLGAEVVSAAYRFENAGGATVAIGAVSTSCGCAAATLGRRVFPPGASGEIELQLNVGDRRGPQVKTAKVPLYEVDAGYAEGDPLPAEPSEVVTLTLKTNIPRAYTLSPRLLLWREPAAMLFDDLADRATAEDAAPDATTVDADTAAVASLEKAAVLRAGRGVSFRVELVRSSSPAFAARVETVRDGEAYRIHVRPTPPEAEPPEAPPPEAESLEAAEAAVPTAEASRDESSQAATPPSETPPAWHVAVITITTDLPQESLREIELVARIPRE